MEIFKIVAITCQILRLECTKFSFDWGSAQDPAGSLQRSPDPLAGFKGPICKGTGGGKRKWREGRGPLYFFSVDLYAMVLSTGVYWHERSI